MKNILILNLSTAPSDKNGKVDMYNYESDNGEFKGLFSNDAPTKYVIDFLIRQNKTLDKILCIKTKKSYEESYSHFEKMVKDFCDEKGVLTPNIVLISSHHASTDMAQTIQQILENVDKDDKIYIDTTGGARNAAYLLMFIVRFLEYEGVVLKKAVLSVHTDNPRRIEDVTSLYKKFELINAANTFTSFGDASELAKLYEGTQNVAITETINAMKEFSEAVTLCKTDLGEIIKKLNVQLKKLSSLQTSDENDILFLRIVDIIKEKFNISKNKEELNYKDVITWCVKNNLIQQAITIYAEKIPEYLYDKKYFGANQSIIQLCRDEKNNYSTAYNLFNKFLNISPLLTFEDFVVNFVKNNEKIKKQIIQSNNIDELINASAYLKKLTDRSQTLKKGLTILFRIKRKMYDECGNRRVNIDKNFGVLEEVTNKIISIKAKNFSGFLNEFANNHNGIASDISPYDGEIKQYNHAKINMIENLEECLNISSDYWITNKISKDDMKLILRDCLYIKKYLRNMINHASEDNKLTKEEKEYFRRYNYPENENLRIDDIKKVIIGALDRMII
ncbi:MAG: hypothetical protein J6A58_04930 [Oscillospiraceae bacterium]|nr:hypothetical protein [Oscillospiraceae bacterium]